MNDLGKEEEFCLSQGDIALRVYTSCLLGHDKSLILYSGGNTSAKIVEKNAFGEDEDFLYVPPLSICMLEHH
ncbi:hypothetical protein SAMN05216420_103195 [Nitrosospira sp. Nl5]|uniref:hypothetical protein n=1 Tax=Nitrosospira sp. Nl5 TaxID=200120 RepID=UPI000885D17C|nr:hypothetical protein [Nitrosospira sp. Nl5]SCY21068.1 hypothetical protein SAMN05216420_103195 [Nitrosospira sp. Nl5]